MTYRGPSTASMTRMRSAYANLLPTTAAIWRKSTPAAAPTLYASNVACRVGRYKAVSGKTGSGPMVYTPASYTEISVEDLRLIDFGYTSAGVVAPDVQRTDQIRIGSKHYNVLDIIDDQSFAVGLRAVCQRSA